MRDYSNKPRSVDMLAVALAIVFVVTFVYLAIITVASLYLPRSVSGVLSAVHDEMVERQPSFRLEDYEVEIKPVAGSRRNRDIYLRHKATGERKCLRLIEGTGFGYGSIIDIDCPPQSEMERNGLGKSK